MKSKYIIGIDEAGRGPLAGPVAVGVACVPTGFDWTQLQEVNDSKQLTEKKREEIYAAAKRLEKAGELKLSVSMVSASVIDKKGIVPSVTVAMKRALKRLAVSPKGTVVKLDGGLKAPEEYRTQETIVKGDSKEKVIGLASIAAKVTRDRYMQRIAQKDEFVLYDFATHKGYGTKKHREAIVQNGFSTEHRLSYCKNIKVL